MKTSKKLRIAAAFMAVSVLFCGCEMSRTCISHIDRDGNGKCDNCGTKMTAVRYNVEKLTIKQKPVKDYYALGEKLDITGGILSVKYNDGTPDAELPFDAEGVTVAQPQMDVSGKKKVAVKYGGKTVSYEIEVGAAKYKVSFDLGYDGAKLKEQTVTVNEYAVKPVNPERSGYDFAGWFTSDEFNKEFDFELNNILADTTVYANWIKRYSVTYNANYPEGESVVKDTVLGLVQDFTPQRNGYKFGGWFYDSTGENQVDYDKVVTENLTIYANWVSESADFYTVTFNYNYGETPETEQVEVAADATVKKPKTPKRANVTTAGHQAQDFRFDGWYTDEAFTNEYNFKNKVSADITLYAKWTGTYIFEAEHVALIDESTGLPLKGMGASGGAEGKGMVQAPASGTEGMNASGGCFVTFLYKKGLALNFNITSDRDVDDVTFIFRITCENKGFVLDPYDDTSKTPNGTQYSKYTVTVNGQVVNYSTIAVEDVLGHENTGGRRPFSDHVLAVNMSLVKGNNKFVLLTDNTHGMGGTMTSTAPVIDCIKLTTSANLDWSPVLENTAGKV